jgi:hypothetical protein
MYELSTSQAYETLGEVRLTTIASVRDVVRQPLLDALESPAFAAYPGARLLEAQLTVSTRTAPAAAEELSASAELAQRLSR